MRSPPLATVPRGRCHRFLASPAVCASGQSAPEAIAAASASSQMTYQCNPTAVNKASSTSRTNSLDVEERLGRVKCGQLSRKQVNGSLSNHTAGSIGMPVRAPFQDITNVVDSHCLSKGKQAQKILGSVDHPITGTKRSINLSGISIQSNTPSTGHTSLPTNASERKRYHDRERYLEMTPEQRAAYLERNREYKRRRKNPAAVSDNEQSGSQTCTCTNGSMHTTILTSSITEGTGQHKRVSAFLDKGSGHKRRRMSNGAGCSNTGKGTHEDGVANEQEDHDSTIYVPYGSFSALEDETGQSEYMTEDDDEDDEGYMFAGHGTDCVLSYRDPNHANCEMQEDPFDCMYRNIPSGHHVLEPVPNCTNCNAKRFQYETPTFCCMGGKVKIVTPYVPDEMRRLYTSQDPDAKYFQDNIRVNWNLMPLWIMNLK
ncbi:hypothetical protein ACQJBY_060013 [Aegilops geniculata]